MLGDVSNAIPDVSCVPCDGTDPRACGSLGQNSCVGGRWCQRAWRTNWITCWKVERLVQRIV
jgi:hypothetical protein